ncbi:hypothetical protein M885DRAFT_616560 [Pelagophyceae sp. CCMP2097]|nr:hypothetical protein M885DRAFT_616560 [Pelagophyceae sp. CCMP2097]
MAPAAARLVLQSYFVFILLLFFPLAWRHQHTPRPTFPRRRFKAARRLLRLRYAQTRTVELRGCAAARGAALVRHLDFVERCAAEGCVAIDDACPRGPEAVVAVDIDGASSNDGISSASAGDADASAADASAADRRLRAHLGAALTRRGELVRSGHLAQPVASEAAHYAPRPIAAAYILEFVALYSSNATHGTAAACFGDEVSIAVEKRVQPVARLLEEATGVAYTLEASRGLRAPVRPFETAQTLDELTRAARREHDAAPADARGTVRLRFILLRGTSFQEPGSASSDSRVFATDAPVTSNAADPGGVVILRDGETAVAAVDSCVGLLRAFLGLDGSAKDPTAVELLTLAGAAAEAGSFAAVEALLRLRDVSRFMRDNGAADESLALLELAAVSASARDVSELTRRARAIAEAALDDPLMGLPGPYFPAEHLVALYAPLAAPLVVPLLYGWLEELRRFRRLRGAGTAIKES